MPNRYWDAPIIFTRVGLSADTLIEMSQKFSSGFTRDQFMQTTKLKITSVRDKLRDMELYGFIQYTNVGIYVITERGKAIISGGAQMSSAIEDAINQSPLWKQLIISIGKTPQRSLFDKAIKSVPSLENIEAEPLNNLWSAFNSDIQCINKTPPFSSQRHQTIRNIAFNPVPKITITQPSLPNEASAPIQPNEETSVRKPHSMEEPDPQPGRIEYRGHVVIVTDDLTAKFAENLVKKMIKDLKRKGVEFDE